MTSPNGPGPSRKYTKRVGDKLQEYAWRQQEDIRDGLLETNRLFEQWYGQAISGGTGEKRSDLLEDWIELWSAMIHYGSALMANAGLTIAGLGYDMKTGKTDTLYPHRMFTVNQMSATPPRIRRCWMIGQGEVSATQIPTDRIEITQSTVNAGSTRWDVIFDLSGDPPGDQKTGMYCVELDIGGPDSEPQIEYFHLEPIPAG